MRLARLSLAMLLFGSMCCKAQVHRVRASYYGYKYAGRLTANGEVFNPLRYTAASLTLPLGSVIVVRNTTTHREICVRVNDRGPYSTKFSLDLSLGAARALGITKQEGWAWVQYQVLKLGDNKYHKESAKK